MADKAGDPEDAVSRAAQRWAARRDQQRAAAKIAIESRARHEPNIEESSLNARQIWLGLAVLAMLVAAGWFLLIQMRCGQHYSNINGLLSLECR